MVVLVVFMLRLVDLVFVVVIIVVVGGVVGVLSMFDVRAGGISVRAGCVGFRRCNHCCCCWRCRCVVDV